MEISNLFQAGGIVMWPLLFFSVLGVALIIERITFWVKISNRQNRIVQVVLKVYRQGNMVDALNILHRNADLPIARIFLAALELEEPNPEEFRLALESEAQAEIPLLKRFQNIFDTIIGLAPLLGLLGTVLGLITSFASLNIGDVGGTKTAGVTSGISEALVSTASGLVVAIITLFFANSFRGMYLRQIAWIQEYGGQLELLYRRRYERGDK
ncbi:MAG: MotA/TolQ/ExbB proton channel family protein [Dolichospermum sp.]|jgi:biopolymer transport protein ExbB|uniref:MotA/TolQ/ExbB proton channel family protein n=1 Tax=Dolichospermum circinale TaxID=109265 RepID=UPI0007FE89E5|nr:MotA/TolQ/ExbB proton channel family protein [Dolichospermum circinale]MBD1213921.1 MotA/TolQ/ExbB proton channel family protein [Dolichospermum circinale Clear-D4]MCE2720095.1 MotA/TolQ/ExbB proton channel family protein [Anabaena sp. 49628_E55]OBQ40897.1 MAG: biopolymer transporter ExbB [Anabaena sp. CRKS33]MDB9454858.1 MotA/TolQ/ExbB proton channel family protein [Dolichospermum circinale CS-541/06]MDB9463653.1 MotA/TolQ/ExbB proton channel family protein [Dolichospermum circinale CS-541